MAVYPVAEQFLSINGEGPRAGQLAYFIRFPGCDLSCSYCDTRWANLPDAPRTATTGEALLRRAMESGAKNVTLTGGEPLLQPELPALLTLLCPHFYVEIETNGARPLGPLLAGACRPSFTMDYKLPSSGMEERMCLENLPLLTELDTVKFVCGSREDLRRALEIMEQYGLRRRTRVYLSPVFGKLDPGDMVEFMKAHRLSDVNLQLQLHKFIWEPDRKGV